ncbi:hypothetical protein I4U23_002205 [Adineta vaga]|nr:hypothetical protein I4U23_002205 [Adineta vaga]
MPRVRVPVRRSGYRYTARPGRRYPAAAPARKGIWGGLAGLLLCLLCLATLGLLGLFATFIAVTAYLGDVYNALKGDASAHFANMAILLVALCFAGYHKISRST